MGHCRRRQGRDPHHHPAHGRRHALYPSHIEVREGETVRLRAQNQGKVMHEIVIGTKAELDQHAEMMVKHPGMEHDEPYMAHVKPGQRGDIVWHFNRPGTLTLPA